MTESVAAVGALIMDARNRVYVQRRSADRRLLPGCRDRAQVWGRGYATEIGPAGLEYAFGGDPFVLSAITR